MTRSRLRDIYLSLKEQGVAVYFPAQKQGECTSPYVVVKDMLTTQFHEFSTTVTYYDVLCYVPHDRFSTLELFVERVKDCMRRLYPMLTPTYEQTASYFDEAVKAYMVSIRYKNYRQIGGLVYGTQTRT